MKTHFLCSIFSGKSCFFCEITWKIAEEPDMPQVTMTMRKRWICMPDLFVFGATAPPPAAQGLLFYEVYRSQTQRRITFGRTPLDEWSARRGDLLPDNKQYSQQTSMPPARFEPAISAVERPQTHTLDRAANGTGACRIAKAIIQTHAHNI